MFSKAIAKKNPHTGTLFRMSIRQLSVVKVMASSWQYRERNQINRHRMAEII